MAVRVQHRINKEREEVFPDSVWENMVKHHLHSRWRVVEHIAEPVIDSPINVEMVKRIEVSHSEVIETHKPIKKKQTKN